MPKFKRFRKAANGQGSIFEEEVKRKDGSSYTRWRADVSLGYDGLGKRKRKTVHGKSQEEVTQKLEALKKQVSLGVTETKLTLADFLEQWLEDAARKLKPTTFAGYEQMCNGCIIPKLGRVKLEKLTPLQVQKALAEIATTISGDRANKARRVLHTALEQAVRWQLVSRNVAKATEGFKHERKTMQLWTPEQVVTFLAYARANRLYAMFYLAISTGLRSGELRALQWSDLQGSTLHVQRSLARVKGELIVSTPKTEKGKRKVRLDEDTLEILSEHRKRQDTERATLTTFTDLGLIFCTQEGTYITPHNLEGIWYRLLESSKAPKVRIHDLRHLNVSLRRKLGQDAKLIADQVGHSDPAFTTRLYTHLFEDDLENAAVSLRSILPKGEGSN